MSHKLKSPPKPCQILIDKLITKYKDCFKTKLGKYDRMNIEPVKLVLKNDYEIKPEYHSRPFDVPYHLRRAWEEEIGNALEAGILKPVDFPTDWASKAFGVPKSDPTKVRIVGDFRKLDKCLCRPHWPTESSGQLLRHINLKHKFFITIDVTSGYHCNKCSLQKLAARKSGYTISRTCM